MFVDDAQVHKQMRAEHVELEVVALDIEAGFLAHCFEQCICQGAVAKDFGHRQLGGQACGTFGQGHKAAARLLRQAFKQGLDLVFEHAGHQPLAALLADLVKHKQRHVHGHTVLGVAGLVQVAGAAVDAAQAHRPGKGLGGDARRLVAHELFAAEKQEARLGTRGVLPPAFKSRAVVDLGGHLAIVERKNQLVVNQHVLPALLVLELLHLRNELVVGRQERQLAVPLIAHQRLTDENLTGAGRVDRAIVAAAIVVDHQTIKRGPLQRRDPRGFFLPMRIEHLLLEQVGADLLEPLRLDGGHATPKQARGLDQLGRHNPAAGPLGQARAGMAVKLDATRAQVEVLLVALAANIAQQAREHR